MQRTVKSGAQKRHEKKLAMLQKAAAQSYSLTISHVHPNMANQKVQEMLMTKLMRRMPKVL